MEQKSKFQIKTKVAADITTHADKEAAFQDLQEKIAKQKRGGRPKKTDGETLTEKVVLLLSKSEVADLKKVSADAELSMNAYIRKLLKKSF